jgi:beta-fructofuranosidase
MIASGQISFAGSVFNQQYIQLIVDVVEGQKVTFLYAQDKESLRLEYDASTSLLSFSRENMGYDIKGIEKKQLTKREVRIPLMDNQLKLEIFRDTSSVEIFTATGETMTFTFYEKEKGKQMHLQTSEGPLVIQRFKSSKISK